MPDTLLAAPAVASRPRAWPWAAGTIALVLLILVSALAVRKYSTSQRQTVVFVPAPTGAQLDVAAFAQPGTTLTGLALDGVAGRLVALTSHQEFACPPTTNVCTPPVVPDTLDLLDGLTGATLAMTPLPIGAGMVTATSPVLADAPRHLAYVAGPTALSIFSTVTGARLSSLALPTGLQWTNVNSGWVDPLSGRVYLAGGQQALAIDPATGQTPLHVELDNRHAIESVSADPERGRFYAIATPLAKSDATLLIAFDMQTLRPLATMTVPYGTRIGPMTPDGRSLLFFGVNGVVRRLALDTPPVTNATDTLAAAPLIYEPRLRDAHQLAVNPVTGHILVANSYTTTLLPNLVDTQVGGLPVAGMDSRALAIDPVDAAHGLIYLTPNASSIVILRDASADPVVTEMSAQNAALLALSALDKRLGTQSQFPPFVSSQTFPLAPGERAVSLYIDAGGWQGPFAGRSTTTLEKSEQGAYRVTFTINWDQAGAHTHQWVFAIHANGDTQLASDSGDAIP